MFGYGINAGAIVRKEQVIKMQKQISEKDYDYIYEDIESDKISSKEMSEYLEDMGFYKYYIRRRTLGSLWKKKK